MALKSNLLTGDQALEACAVSHAAHVIPGASGPHVRKIQSALTHLDGAAIEPGELDLGFYGPSTAAAVLSYKQQRDIINHSYQSVADNIVGIMTIAALDNELLAQQVEPPVRPDPVCGRPIGIAPRNIQEFKAGLLRR